jgi:hypothetical protein
METGRKEATEAVTAPEPGTGSSSNGRVIRLPSLPSLPQLPGIRQLSMLRPQIELPSRDKMVLYAGLGAMAVLNFIDWPVAVAIAAAQVLASKGAQPAPSTVAVRQAPTTATRTGSRAPRKA